MFTASELFAIRLHEMTSKSEKELLLQKIDEALVRLSQYREKGLFQSETICLQLECCRDKLLGKGSEALTPFTMGLIATREFDMWGDEPDLAEAINWIQTQMRLII